MPKTILLVDDHPVFRRGLHQILEKKKDLKVVGEAGDGLEAIERFRDLSPDIVVMDINMPNFDGIEATRQILAESPDTKVVALSVHSGKQFVRDMIQAGASGYILKESIPEEMIAGIRKVLSGEVYLSQSISDILISDYKTLISEPGRETEDDASPILYTKLHPPPIASHIVPRTRLIEVLENGARNPMTLIAAPAGYGKSILASQWLDVSDLPGAWVSLGKSDNDLRLFLNYFFEAIANLFPQHPLKAKSLLNATELPSASAISRYLLNDLVPLSERFILALDDFHLIHNPKIHDFVEELLVHPSPIMHLALITRRDPPLPLTSLRSRGMLTEITTSHLRFTVSETKSFLERFLHMAIADKTAQILEEKIEGWVTGLHLAALSIKDEADQERLTAGLLETPQYVQDYLFQEVISHVPPEIRPYLLQTAILDRFCAPLCGALAEADSCRSETEKGVKGQEFIDWLMKTKLFIISLDTRNRWFRWHHLFQDILQNHLMQGCSAEEIAKLHLQASEWFERQDLIDEAIHHMLAAGETLRAAEIVELHRHDEMNQDRWYVIGRWLGLLPPEIIRQRPVLLLAQAWQRFNQFRLLEIPPILERVSALIEDEPVDASVLGELDFHWGYLSIWLDGDGKAALKRLAHARNRLPEKYREFAAEIEFDMALARQMIGEGDSAIASLDERMRTAIAPNAMLTTRLVGAKVFICLMSGDLSSARPAAQQMRSVARNDGNIEIMAWGDYLTGLIYIQSYRLNEALKSFRSATEEKEILHRKAAVETLTGLVLTYQALHRIDDAVNSMNQLLAFALETADPQHVAAAESCRARLALLLGDLASADSWAQSFDAEPHAPGALFWLEVPLITQARVRIATGIREGLESALVSLDSLRQQGTAMHFTCLTIEIDVLQSVALEKLERTGEALKTLEEVVALAQPGGWIRPFVEAGPVMAGLLTRLSRQNIAVAYIDRILAAFPDAAPTSPVPDLPSTKGNHRGESETVAQFENRKSKIENSLVEPLTNRELDVLELLAQRFQNKEIADKLSISTVTVKSHLKNIYQKLGVTGRRQAVEKAKKISIL